MDVKKKIFAELDEICSKDTILASNTSCLSIVDMAAVTTRPEKVLGLHFFVPPQVMALLEIVRTIATDDETVEISRKWGESLGKTCVIAKDTPGFIVNALMNPYLLDAIRMYEAGIASREDIDTAIRLGLNYPMGPLTLTDFAGVDIIGPGEVGRVSAPHLSHIDQVIDDEAVHLCAVGRHGTGGPELLARVGRQRNQFAWDGSRARIKTPGDILLLDQLGFDRLLPTLPWLGKVVYGNHDVLVDEQRRREIGRARLG